MPRQLVGICIWVPLMATVWLFATTAMIGWDILTRPGFHPRALSHELRVRAIPFNSRLKYRRYLVTCPGRARPFRVTVVDRDMSSAGAWVRARYPGCALSLPPHSFFSGVFLP